MANIRGFNDIRDNGRSGDRQGLMNNIAGGMFFNSSTSQPKDPRDESFLDMLKLNVCPQLTFYSFAVIFSLILAGMFFAQMGVDGLDRRKLVQEFLPINSTGPLTRNLSNNYDKIKGDYQFWRFASALLIHVNAYHLLANILSLVIWASYFEVFIPSKRMPFNFFIAGALSRDRREHIRHGD